MRRVHVYAQLFRHNNTVPPVKGVCLCVRTMWCACVFCQLQVPSASAHILQWAQEEHPLLLYWRLSPEKETTAATASSLQTPQSLLLPRPQTEEARHHQQWKDTDPALHSFIAFVKSLCCYLMSREHPSHVRRGRTGVELSSEPVHTITPLVKTPSIMWFTRRPAVISGSKPSRHLARENTCLYTPHFAHSPSTIDTHTFSCLMSRLYMWAYWFAWTCMCVSLWCTLVCVGLSFFTEA